MIVIPRIATRIGPFLLFGCLRQASQSAGAQLLLEDEDVERAGETVLNRD
jgi:hypothetical protein